MWSFAGQTHSLSRTVAICGTLWYTVVMAASTIESEVENTLRVRMPVSLLARLDARAAQWHRTRSGQARFIIEGWLDYEDAVDERESRPGPPPAPPRKRRSKRR